MLAFSNSTIQWVYYNLKAHLDVTFVYKNVLFKTQHQQEFVIINLINYGKSLQ